MKITDVKCRIASIVIPEEQRHYTNYGYKIKSDCLIVEVHTDEGLIGYGGTIFGNVESVKYLVEQPLKEQLIGEDPTNIERLWMKMYCGNRFEKALDSGVIMPSPARRGEMICAISGVDIALWDILGKVASLPLYKLLGSCRNKILGYASGGWKDKDGLEKELLSYVEAGFKAVKIRIHSSSGPQEIERAIERIRIARTVLGDDIDIFCEGHSGFSIASAVKLARALEEYNIGWFEEPITPDDHEGLAYVRSKTRIPIATGEQAWTRFEFLSLLRHNCADILQPDLGMCGGLSEGRRIGALASSYNVKVASHNFCNPVVKAASIHYALSEPTYYIYEVHQGKDDNALLSAALVEPFDIRDGYVYPPSRPGLGIEFKPDFFEKYPYIPGPEWIKKV